MGWQNENNNEGKYYVMLTKPPDMSKEKTFLEH